MAFWKIRNFGGFGYGIRLHLELFVFTEVTPLPQGQFPKFHFTYADALEAGHFETDQFTHPADLALFPLAQDKT